MATSFGLVLALLVQVLGKVIASFSARYLEGEANQRGYIGALAVVLCSVHLLVIADNWLLLIAAWPQSVWHFSTCFAFIPIGLCAACGTQKAHCGSHG